MTSLAPTLQAYRDSLRLLIGFVCAHTDKQPYQLDFDDLDGPIIGSFLTYLEQQRGNTVRTRNARLAAIHSLFRYAALRHPEHAASIQRVLAIPTKRFDRAVVCYLTKTEAEALLAAPDQATWLGRRDHALLSVAIQTGLRVAELTGLRVTDAVLTHGPHIRARGKGR
jgi:integrase/recombinase XerD